MLKNLFNGKLLIIFWIIPQIVLAQQKASISEENISLKTYAFNDPNPVPILTERNSRIYPYHSFEGYTTESKNQKWKVVKLENDYIEVYVLPEAGGKVWGAIEKSTGEEFIYKNEVMKFRNIAMRGPWTSGGIEFNFGLIGHTPSTATPVDYLTRENEDGSVSCIVGNIDLPSRTQWRVEIIVPKDKAYFETRATYYNPTPIHQSYYNWMTGAAVVSNDLEFFYPGLQKLGHGGRAYPWPLDEEGRDLSKYPNNAFGSHKSFHVVGEYNDFMGGYYHNSKFGFGHWALYDEMPGQKLWLWALSRNGGIWEDLLTDTDGQYMEFQAGRQLNQYSPSSYKTPITKVPFAPYSTDRWSEIWFPFKEIGGMKDVSPKGVLNVTHDGGNLKIGVNALAAANTTIIARSGGEIIYSKDHSFKPMDVSTVELKLKADAPFDITVEGMGLHYSSEKKNLLKRPFTSDVAGEKATAYTLYHEGMELKEVRQYNGAKEKFKKCLQEDAMHIDAMVALSEIYYRSIQYDSGLYYVNKALRLDTYHPEANYQAGNLYHAQEDLINALESFGWAARSMEFRSAAYSQMAGINLQLADYDLAEHYALKALDYNQYNYNALQNLAVAYRKNDKPEKANEALQKIKDLDPLNHFAYFEQYLVDPSAENYSKFSNQIKNEFPYQTHLEVFFDYYKLNLKEESIELLKKAPAHPLISLWKAYIENDVSALVSIASASPAFVFPYRKETVAALEWAASKNENWKFKYYLALNYWGLQREDKAEELLIACGNKPDYAPFYMARAYLLKSLNPKMELENLQMAHRLSPEEWRTWSKLINYYEKNENIQQALQLSTKAYKKFKDNYSIGLQYAKALTANGQYAKSLKILNDIHVLPFEGASEGRAVYEEALLLLSLELIEKKKYKEALEKLEASRAWPENLGVGKPYEVDTRIQDYLSAYSLMKLNKASEASELNRKVVATSLEKNDSHDLKNILALKILKQNAETEKMEALLQNIKESSASSDISHWIIAAFENDEQRLNSLEKRVSRNRYFSIIKKINHL